MEGRWWESAATCPRPVESNAGVRDRDCAAQKMPEGNGRQTHDKSII